MIRVSVPYIYNLLEAFVPLTAIKNGDKVSDHLFSIFNAENLLNQFLDESLWGGILRVCRQPGKQLAASIAGLHKDKQVEDVIDYWRVVGVTQNLANFKTVLEAEFLTAATYVVPPRRGYDIAALLDRAEIIFPDDLVEKVPNVLFDLREAGKCIAFDLGTAAGFHLLRALETVICSYWNAVMEGDPLPSNRNLGNYIALMEKANKGDGKVLASLRQIKDHHRNSLMHPEETLTLDDSIALMGIVQSAVIAMLSGIPPKLQSLQPETT